MVNVTNGADIGMGLITLELFLSHLAGPLIWPTYQAVKG
jgi:hypothetical protein